MSKERKTKRAESGFILIHCPEKCIKICNECEVFIDAKNALGRCEDITNNLLQKRRDFDD